MVWILLSIGLLLIFFNFKAINKEKNSFNKVFNNTEEDMKEFDFKLSELRREFSETILELQKEIEQIKESFIYENDTIESNINENYVTENNIIETKGKENINEEYNENNLDNVEENNNSEKAKIKQINKNDNNIKIDEINSLLTEGYSIEDISEKLGIGKGEVLLIKELYIK